MPEQIQSPQPETEVNVIDGKAVFATHKIILDVEIDGQDEIYCFSEKHKNIWTERLKQRQIKYEITTLKTDEKREQKCKGIKFQSRSEALAYLDTDKEPESLSIPKLKHELQETKQRLELSEQKEKDLEAEIAEIKQSITQLEADQEENRTK